ncbi:hypothetical protein [Sphingobium sp.]|uniref:hypothetical protein n=1 Tax=Sphingobium sp. TaxID=1912891 RepID=UPI0028BD27FB|nr:hypothetical protein [Sphingobium sp.]
MAVSDMMITAWITAIERFRQARSAWMKWNGSNPSPPEDPLPEDMSIEEEAAIFADWEKGSDAARGPYDEACETLYALPAPNLEAVIVKLQLVREVLEGRDVELELAPILQLVEQDLRRLADEQGSVDGGDQLKSAPREKASNLGWVGGFLRNCSLSSSASTQT